MRILIVGSYSPFSVMLIEKLTKENHSCFMLTSQKEEAGKWIRQKILEEYNFAYDSDSVRHVIESVNPEKIIFTGAYDTWFDFKSIKQQPVEYTAGLVNLLISGKLCGVPHFVYLSSCDIFEGSFTERVKETMTFNAAGIKGKTVAWGEEICRSYFDDEMDVTIMRIANLYGFPRKQLFLNDFWGNLCKKAILGEVVVVDKTEEFSCIYLADAIEAVYQILSAKVRKEHIYHVASYDIINGEMILEVLSNLVEEKKFEASEQEYNRSCVLSSERLREEFRFSEKYKFAQVAPAIFKYYKKHEKEILGKKKIEERQKGDKLSNKIKDIFKKLFPYVENIVGFLIIFVLSSLIKSDVLREINWFLLYALVFAVVHGRRQAIMSCLLSVAGQMFLWSGETGWIIALTDVGHYLWILMLFIVGLTTGHLKDSYVQSNAEQTEYADYLKGEIEELTGINEQNLGLKKLYEDRIINYQDSLGKIYAITSQLDELEPGKILINAALVIEQIMKTENVTIYNVVNSDYCRMAVATSELARSLPKSLQYRKTGEMYERLSEEKVYMNTTLEENLPSMAHAIYNLGEMEMIIMIWGMKLEQLTLYQSNLMMILGKMLFASIDRAYRYLESISSKRFVGVTRILDQKAFEEIIDNEKYARELNMSQFTILEIERDDKALEEWDEVLKGTIRNSDYLGILSDKKLGILLTNTESADTLFVKERLKNRGIESVIGGY